MTFHHRGNVCLVLFFAISPIVDKINAVVSGHLVNYASWFLKSISPNQCWIVPGGAALWKATQSTHLSSSQKRGGWNRCWWDKMATAAEEGGAAAVEAGGTSPPSFLHYSSADAPYLSFVDLRRSNHSTEYNRISAYWLEHWKPYTTPSKNCSVPPAWQIECFNIFPVLFTNVSTCASRCAL